MRRMSDPSSVSHVSKTQDFDHPDMKPPSPTSKPPPSLLLVIPAFDEVQRLPPFLEELSDEIAASEHAGNVELLVVDDGSPEAAGQAMAAQVESVRRNHQFLRPILRLAENQGKGGAVYSGWNQAHDETRWLGFVDADGAVAANEVMRLLESLFADDAASPAPALFALRDVSDRSAVQRTVIRGLLGRIFALCVQTLFSLPVRDTQCGLKFVPNSAFREFRGKLVERRFCFDVELASWLVRTGVPITGVPIKWKESPGSKIRFSSAVQMIFSLLALRFRLPST